MNCLQYIYSQKVSQPLCCAGRMNANLIKTTLNNIMQVHLSAVFEIKQQIRFKYTIGNYQKTTDCFQSESLLVTSSPYSEQIPPEKDFHQKQIQSNQRNYILRTPHKWQIAYFDCSVGNKPDINWRRTKIPDKSVTVKSIKTRPSNRMKLSSAWTAIN